MYVYNDMNMEKQKKKKWEMRKERMNERRQSYNDPIKI